MPWYTCAVNNVGPATDGTETSAPVIYINLTDTGNAHPVFTSYWFFAAEGGQNSMLAVALAAMNGGKHVQVAALSDPSAGNGAFIEIQRFYLNAT